jgi:lipopolysaccharide biosynthesis glycosyltransferase
MLAFDTEDDSRGNPLLINFYDGVSHFTFTDTLKAWEWIAAQQPAHVWACNTEYDLINLFQGWTAKVLTLQYVSSGLMRATMDESDITFYDTLRHWPMSVQAMGEYIGKSKFKDYLSDKVTPKLIDACRRDTEIVYDFVSQMLGRYFNLGLKIKSTLPSMAMQYWQTFNRRDLPRLKKETRERFREGYYGGRVEVFQFKEISGPIYHYDVNSLYPFVMRENLFPDITGREKQTRNPDFGKYGMAHIDIEIPFNNIPPLPYRSEKEIMFPYGKISGAYCYPEIRKALEDGGKISRINWAIEYADAVNPFSDYVETCYGNRLQARNDLDKTFWKLMMNSLYGKFASNDKLLTISKDREYTITSASRFSNVIWSAYVTAYARLVLLKYLRQAREVFYCDTDSVFTPNQMKVSKELGALKLEGVYKRCEFFGNKVYVVDDTYRARGVPRKRKDSENDPARDFIRTGRCIFRRPARLRESRRSFAQANVWYNSEKHFKATYTKRKILTNGNTRPLTLTQYGI